MAEFLIYNDDTWMDKLKPADLIERLKDTSFKARYDRRIRPGDIIKVYPDGTCTEPPSPDSKMAIIKIPDMTFNEAKGFESAGYDDPEKENLVMKRRFQISLANLTPEALSTLSSTGVLTLTITEFNIIDTDKLDG